MNNRKKIVIVGATSAIAENCARLWVKQRPADITLIGRHTQRLVRTAKDLLVRSPQSSVNIVTADFLNPSEISNTVNNTFQKGCVDIALIAHGALVDQTTCQNDLESCKTALEINGVSPALYAEAFARQMEKANHGVIAAIGSVAGDRGRKSNYSYGAAKGMLDRYIEGMQHRLASSGVVAILIKPGPTDTPMTSHLKKEGANLASVESVAQTIVDAISKKKNVVYAPGRWSIIMLIIRLLPRFIFNKLNI